MLAPLSVRVSAKRRPARSSKEVELERLSSVGDLEDARECRSEGGGEEAIADGEVTVGDGVSEKSAVRFIKLSASVGS